MPVRKKAFDLDAWALLPPVFCGSEAEQIERAEKDAKWLTGKHFWVKRTCTFRGSRVLRPSRIAVVTQVNSYHRKDGAILPYIDFTFETGWSPVDVDVDVDVVDTTEEGTSGWILGRQYKLFNELEMLALAYAAEETTVWNITAEQFLTKTAKAQIYYGKTR